MVDLACWRVSQAGRPLEMRPSFYTRDAGHTRDAGSAMAVPTCSAVWEHPICEPYHGDDLQFAIDDALERRSAAARNNLGRPPRDVPGAACRTALCSATWSGEK